MEIISATASTRIWGFPPRTALKNIRRLGEVAKLFRDAGVISMTAFISPYGNDRLAARQVSKDHGFIEVFADCPVRRVCEERDPKGSYKKGREGIIKEFTGVSAPYEEPENPEIHLHTDKMFVEACVRVIVDYLVTHHYIPA